MDNTNLKRLRILNLLDIVNPNFNELKKELNYSNNIVLLNSSIFAAARKDEFESLTRNDAPYILAWGTDTKLDVLKAQAFKCLSGKTTIGIQSSKTSNPLSQLYLKPPNFYKQQEIIKELVSKFNEVS